MSKPISPDEIGSLKARSFPPEVFESFNELLAAKYSNGRASIKQDEVIDLIMSKLKIENRSVIFDKGYLNVEEAYQEQGWNVEYTKPDYTESFPSYFTFTRKKNSGYGDRG